MTIVKETLQTQLDELKSKHYSRAQEVEQDAAKQAKSILDKFGFNMKQISVDSDSIRVTIPEISHWDAITIKRDRTYQETGPKYHEPKLEYRSSGEIDAVGLKYLEGICDLARNFVHKTEDYNALIGTMTQIEAHYMSEEHKTRYSQICELEKTIREISNKEQQDSIDKLLNEGKIKLDKTITFHYGPNRFDYVNSDEWEWEENKGGKTFTVYYFFETRTNPFYDENGDRLEPVIERRKSSLHKRIKRDNLLYFLKYNCK